MLVFRAKVYDLRDLNAASKARLPVLPPIIFNYFNR